MKILYLADGGSIHTLRYIKYFYDEGHQVELISMRPIRDELKQYLHSSYQSKFCSNNFLVHLFYTLLNLPFIIRRIRKSRADIIHAHDLMSYGPFAYFSGKDYLVSPWGTDILITSKKNKLFYKLSNKILQKAKQIFYDGGQHVFNELINRGVEPKKINKIYFGVDVDLFKRTKESRVDLRKFLRMSCPISIKEETKLINVISTRNHEPVYDVKTLIYAIPIIVNYFQDKNIFVNFTICGSGSLTNELMNLANSNYNLVKDIDSHIYFAGRLSSKEMVEHLSGSDIYVSTSLSDAGLAASTAEAMSCSLPVVITNFGDNGSWVKPGINGELFEPSNEKDLANQIIKLIESKNRLAIGKTNRKLIEEKNNYKTEMRKVEDIYYILNQYCIDV